MAKCVRAPSAFAEDLVQFPAPTWQLTTVCQSCSRGPSTLSALYGHQGCLWYTYVHTGQLFTHTQKKNPAINVCVGFYVDTKIFSSLG